MAGIGRARSFAGGPPACRVAAACLTAAFVLLTATSARAEERAWLGAGLEVFGGHALDGENRDLFSVGGGAALHVEALPIAPLGIHVGGVLAGLSSGDSAESTDWFALRAGLRLHWGTFLEMAHDDGWVDAHYVMGTSGQISRSGFDVGAGYELSILPGLRVGPFARIQWASDPLGRDPVLLFVGASVGLLGDPRIDVPEGVPDTDGDGVVDPDDHCPTEPQGARPDPERPGCPLADHDGDGVLDPDDACPTVPAGDAPDPERPGCPAADRDGDGVLDPNDHCPDVHQGRRPDPERPGCPLPDRDNDTVPDVEDACPDEPGAPSLDPEKNGCPGLVRIQHGQVEIERPVYFATNRDVILEESFPVLEAVAEAIEVSGIQRLRIEGHTDSVGEDAYNLDLSQRRAESVRRWLIDQGVPPDVLVAEGFGESRPVDSNETELGRAANRRVEFHIVDDGSTGSGSEAGPFDGSSGGLP